MNLSKLGIVILNYNTHQHVIRCVNSIIFFYGKTVNVVVVDNQSSDDSFSILEDSFRNYPNIEVISSGSNRGYSSGNNFGFRHLIKLHGDIEYLAVINPDVLIIDGNIFQNLLARLSEDDSLAGISPLMILNDFVKPERWAYKFSDFINSSLSSLVILKPLNPVLYRSYKVRTDNLVAYVDVIPGSFFIMKKNVFERICFLDEKIFLYGEENILAIKIRKENLRLGLSFRDYYLHNHASSKSSLSNDLKHLKYSLTSQMYFNFNYKNKFWGILDTVIMIVFLPIRVFEVILLRLYSVSRMTHNT